LPGYAETGVEVLAAELRGAEVTRRAIKGYIAKGIDENSLIICSCLVE
jgi:hypothetical protein